MNLRKYRDRVRVIIRVGLGLLLGLGCLMCKEEVLKEKYSVFMIDGDCI